MKKTLLATVMAFACAGCNNSINVEIQSISLGEQTFICEVAQTEKERQHGLMNRHNRETNHGMLFVFEKPDFHTFWMKDTPLALDIIWINEADKVSQFVTANTCKSKICPTYRPEKIAKYVVEVAAGTFQGHINDDFKFID